MSFLQKPSLTWQKFRDFISRPTQSRTMGIVVILVLVSAVSLTVIVAQQQQTIKQRAASWTTACETDTDCYQSECITSSCQDYACASSYKTGSCSTSTVSNGTCSAGTCIASTNPSTPDTCIPNGGNCILMGPCVPPTVQDSNYSCGDNPNGPVCCTTASSAPAPTSDTRFTCSDIGSDKYRCQGDPDVLKYTNQCDPGWTYSSYNDSIGTTCWGGQICCRQSVTAPTTEIPQPPATQPETPTQASTSCDPSLFTFYEGAIKKAATIEELKSYLEGMNANTTSTKCLTGDQYGVLYKQYESKFNQLNAQQTSPATAPQAPASGAQTSGKPLCIPQSAVDKLRAQFNASKKDADLQSLNSLARSYNLTGNTCK